MSIPIGRVLGQAMVENRLIGTVDSYYLEQNLQDLCRIGGRLLAVFSIRLSPSSVMLVSSAFELAIFRQIIFDFKAFQTSSSGFKSGL